MECFREKHRMNWYVDALLVAALNKHECFWSNKQVQVWGRYFSQEMRETWGWNRGWHLCSVEYYGALCEPQDPHLVDALHWNAVVDTLYAVFSAVLCRRASFRALLVVYLSLNDLKNTWSKTVSLFSRFCLTTPLVPRLKLTNSR